MQLINWKKFVTVILDLSKKAIIIYIAYIKAKMIIYLAQNIQIALLLAKKVAVLEKYSKFTNIFSKK